MADLGAIGICRDECFGVRLPVLRPAVVIPPMPLTVSGVIYDDTGAEADRTVRIYDRATGELLGETVSDSGDGTYSLAAPAVDDVPEVQRIALDDDAGTLYNDIIDRVIPG